MSNEIKVAFITGANLYFVVQSAGGGWWYTTGTAFEAYNAAHWAGYAVPMVEQGASGDYFGDFPTGIVSGTYRWEARSRTGGTPATTDPPLVAEDFVWGGSSGSVTPPPVGWPTNADVQAKLALSAPDGLTPAITDDIDALLRSVIAEFQSAPAADGSGGTGRLFTPTLTTYLFDGNGDDQLDVWEIVAEDEGGTALVVTGNGASIAGVLAARHTSRQPCERLMIPYTGGTYLTFPVGRRNISVTATWGYAAALPDDVWEAVRCEAAARALAQGAVPLSGIGDMLSIGSYSINTAAGVSVWKESSPIAVLHRTYEETLARYRNPAAVYAKRTVGLPALPAGANWR